MTDKEKYLAEASRTYRQYSEQFGIKDPVILDLIERAYYAGMEKHEKELLDDSLKAEQLGHPVTKTSDKEPANEDFPYNDDNATLDAEIKSVWNKLSHPDKDYGRVFTADREGFIEVVTHFAGWQRTKDFKLFQNQGMRVREAYRRGIEMGRVEMKQQLMKTLPHWHKSNLPHDSVTGLNSENLAYNGYYINYIDLFNQLPKEEE